jgi:NADH:ubiquinone oxidoreductase subunit 4 (subunit M)
MLAGIILKLGIYGIIHLSMIYALDMFIVYMFLYISMLIASMITAMNSDVKMLIAFSSVVHMTLGLIIVLFNQVYLTTSSIIASITHAILNSTLYLVVVSIIASVLFALVSFEIYIRHFRLVYTAYQITRHIIYRISVFIIANFSSPPIISFIPEMIAASIIMSL